MKKSLLSFLTLTLCICLLTSKTFAQTAPGAMGGGSTPPSYIKGVKRNNGNGTTANGLAEVRLQIAKSFTGDIKLLDVRSIDDPLNSLNAVGADGLGTPEKGYLSYELTKNVDPAKKLLFYFLSSDGTIFCIGE